MFKVNYDASNGIIRCASGGFMTVEEVNKSAGAVQDFMQKSWTEFGSVAMLVVSTGTVVQSPEVIEATKNNMRRLRPNDRVAIIMSSHLAKLQSDRAFQTNHHLKAFTSEPEARAWLTAGRHRANRTAAA